MTQYRPIVCSVYDVFERAALKGHTVQICVDNTEMPVRITDVYARGNEEFLNATNTETNVPMVVRLDRIQWVFDPIDNKTYIPNQC